MTTPINKIELQVIDCPTILIRVIQVIKKKGFLITNFNAESKTTDEPVGIISIDLQSSPEELEILMRQLNRIIEVTEVKRIGEKKEYNFTYCDFIPAY